MDKKRFQMGRRIDVVSDIYDSQNDKLLILSDVVDLLNELLEENNKLKELNDDKGKRIISLIRTNKTLNEENEQLRKSAEYWQKKYEQGTETFQIIENDTTFQFNSNQAQLYTIKSVSTNGVVCLGNGHKAQWRMKDIREINAELPPFEEFNRETFMQMRNKFRKFDKDVLGRIIYNIYIGIFGEYL